MSGGRARLVVAGLASVLAGTLAGACGVPADDHARVEPDEAVPFDLLDAPTTSRPSTEPAPASGPRASVCLVGDGRLVAVERAVPDAASPADVLEALADGPSASEAATGVTTALPEDAFDLTPRVVGGVATVDLTAAFTDTEGRRQLLAVAQLACTLTERPGIGQVAFTLDGDAIEVPRGDGTTTSDPVARDDYRNLLP